MRFDEKPCNLAAARLADGSSANVTKNYGWCFACLDPESNSLMSRMFPYSLHNELTYAMLVLAGHPSVTTHSSLLGSLGWNA